MTSAILNGEILGQSQVCKKQYWQDPVQKQLKGLRGVQYVMVWLNLDT